MTELERERAIQNGVKAITSSMMVLIEQCIEQRVSQVMEVVLDTLEDK